MPSDKPIKASTDYEAMAAQLGKPEGEEGLEIMAMMNQNNAEMNRFAIDVLECDDYEEVLEVGPANGKFTADLLKKGKGIRYTGADISAIMIDEACKLNQKWVAAGQARFVLFDGTHFPFMDNCFDKIFSVNTLYFWNDPAVQLQEIRRILKPGGIFCLAIGSRSFMERLPFSRFGFKLYEEEEAEELLTDQRFILTESFVRRQERALVRGQEMLKEQVFILSTK